MRDQLSKLHVLDVLLSSWILAAAAGVTLPACRISPRSSMSTVRFRIGKHTSMLNWPMATSVPSRLIVFVGVSSFSGSRINPKIYNTYLITFLECSTLVPYLVVQVSVRALFSQHSIIWRGSTPIEHSSFISKDDWMVSCGSAVKQSSPVNLIVIRLKSKISLLNVHQ